jgi:mannose-6-phosphate isomerase-like protein (cupin superfamily)
MAYAGQILENLVSTERIIFRKTAADTAGELLAFELFLAPDGHVHPEQEERFEVVKGTMRFRRGPKTVFARAGDTVVVPPAVVHRFENPGDQPAHVLVEVRPALRMEQLLDAATALAREGYTNGKGMPKPLAWLAASRGLDERYLRPSAVLVDGTLPAHTDPSYPLAGQEVA